MTKLSQRKTKLSFTTDAEVRYRGRLRVVVIEAENGFTATGSPAHDRDIRSPGEVCTTGPRNFTSDRSARDNARNAPIAARPLVT